LQEEPAHQAVQSWSPECTWRHYLHIGHTLLPEFIACETLR